MNQIIFIVGPTATGKSEVALALAKTLKAEIVSCDSMLIYKEPAIITAKPSKETLKEVKHHFINSISVKKEYNVFDYYKAARKKIEQLIKKKTKVIVCGGTGLYMKALLDGIFKGPAKDEVLRKQLEERAGIQGNKTLYEELERVDKQASQKISQNDLKRIIRALEVYQLTGKKISSFQGQDQGLYSKFKIRIFAFSLDRQALYERINIRTDKMFALGLLKEVEGLLKKKLSITAQKIIGISEIKSFLNKDLSQDEAKELIKKNTRQFAKRQLTWFRKDKRVEWIDIANLKPSDIGKDILRRLKSKVN